MQVVRLMYLELKDVPEEDLGEAIKNYVLCYDNMCQLDSLKASKEDLPLPPPFHSMWKSITKSHRQAPPSKPQKPQMQETLQSR